MNRRVVVSGLGLVTPLGTGQAEFARNLFAGRCGIAPLSLFGTSPHASRVGATVVGFEPRDWVSLRNLRRMDRLSSMAAAAARMALDDAGLTIDAANRDRVGIVLGVAFGSTDVAVQFAGTLFGEGPQRVNPMLVPNTVMNAPAGHSAIELGLRGVSTTVNHQQASAEMALAYASTEIARGRADVVLAGGVDILSPFCFEILTRFRALSPTAGGREGARPFDRSRNGPVAGEGAGIVCLEAMPHAAARGATAYCELGGWGLSAAPAPLTGWPRSSRGPLLAMSRALRAAGIGREAVDYVCASANGGQDLDRLEAEALWTLFGVQARQPAVSSIKGALGESFSSGGIRAAAMALAIRQGMIPPTLGLRDPIRPLRFIRDSTCQAPIDCGLVNGFSFGGTFATLVFRSLGNKADFTAEKRVAFPPDRCKPPLERLP